jgi:dimethylaniline monooxygenase (N-oxide forming)
VSSSSAWEENLLATIMKVCVIGAGAAGLCAVRHALSFGCDVMAFEQSDQVGGTWNYSDNIGKDKYGNDIHSSMYKRLHTNLPKELMSFPDLLFPPQQKSFIPAKDVDDYLKLYANAFKVLPHIKFEHQVIRTKPLAENRGWEIIVLSLADRTYATYIFDIVLLCNGHFSSPFHPHYDGKESFRGTQMHSHDYRLPDGFSGRKVLIVGSGPSGTDISKEIALFASKVVWSHHSTQRRTLSANILQKPDVQRLTERGAIFIDGSSESFDTIVYCTGYNYTFPFLSVDSGIQCEDNYVRPLYKHCLSINSPSLAFIGLPVYVCPFQMFDLQIRFCLTFMTGQKKLPSKDEMHQDTERDMNDRWMRGLKKRKAHAMGQGFQERYFAELATETSIEPIKPFVTRMYNENRRNMGENSENYRKFKFTLLDDENFEMKLLP